MPTPAVKLTLNALELAQAGRFADVRELFVAQLQPLVVPDALQAAWQAELAKEGNVAAVGTPLSAAEPIAPWKAPDYADPASFEEHEVTLGSGALAVAGTVSLPHQITAGPRRRAAAGLGFA